MTREGTCLSSLNSCVSREMLTDPRDRKYYSDIYRCWPPPWVMLAISTCQLALFCYHSGHVSWPQLGDTGEWSEVSLDSLLVFCPHRWENTRVTLSRQCKLSERESCGGS